MDTLEKKVTDAVLQRESDTLSIGGKDYPLAPPTSATIILVSELVADMPVININVNSVVLETLRTARDCKVVGKIIATLLLGAKRIRENNLIDVEMNVLSERFSLRKFRKITVVKKQIIRMTEVEYLSNLILEEIDPKILSKVIGKRLVDMGINDFFGLTTSLSEANILKRTKEVVAIQSGD